MPAIYSQLSEPYLRVRGKVTDMDYVTIISYTTDAQKQAVMENIRKTSQEEVPMMTFVAPNDLNKELRDWIDETLA